MGAPACSGFLAETGRSTVRGCRTDLGEDTSARGRIRTSRLHERAGDVGRRETYLVSLSLPNLEHFEATMQVIEAGVASLEGVQGVDASDEGILGTISDGSQQTVASPSWGENSSSGNNLVYQEEEVDPPTSETESQEADLTPYGEATGITAATPEEQQPSLLQQLGNFLQSVVNAVSGVPSTGTAPDFIVSEGGVVYPVPQGATGPDSRTDAAGGDRARRHASEPV